MKTSLMFILFFLNSFQPVFSQPNWFWQNPSPTGNDLYNLQFTDLFTGYALGMDFTILKTTNSGENWINKQMNVDFNPSGLNGNMKAIYFINSFTGFVGRNGIYKTINGGETWSYHNTDAIVNSICFTNTQTGFAGCDNGKIIKTIDGGNNWFNLFSIEDTTIHLYKIGFISRNIGFAVGEYQTILKTTNQGNNWIIKNGNLGYPLFDFCFVNNSTGYATGDFGNIIKTTDQGESWTYLNYFTTRNLRNIHFVSPDTGYLVLTYSYGSEGKIFKTTNGGNQWSLNFDLGYNINRIAFINNNNAVIAADGGNLYKTSNSGINWNNKIKSVSVSNIKSVCFINDYTGFAAGSNNEILKTYNGGREWQKLNSPARTDNYDYIKFFDNENGYLAGNRLYKTSNSGLSWHELLHLSGYEYKQINFLNLDTGYYLKNKNLYKTFNGGKNWISQFSTFAAQRFYFMNNNDTGFLLTSYSVNTVNNNYNDIFKTINNGLTWKRIQTIYNGFNAGFFNSIYFVNSETGFLSGTPGIKKTTNGGINWITCTDLKWFSGELYFYNPEIGYVSNNNMIFKTSNSGSNWIQILKTSKNLNSYFFNNENIGYVVGQFGYILKTTTGGVVSATEEYVNIPSSFYLYQNYPNPFNPVTKIEFGITKKSRIKLMVYDILGKNVKSIVDSDLPEGKYTYDFDGSNLSSGIYFYRLDTENFSQTRKMLLIK